MNKTLKRPDSTDYAGCRLAISQCIAGALARANQVCDPDSSGVMIGESTLDGFADRLKPLFQDHELDAQTQRELNRAFKTLLTELEAILASWKVFYRANANGLDLDPISKDHMARVIAAGKTCQDQCMLALEKLIRAETHVRTQAETFIAMVALHAEEFCILHRSTPQSTLAYDPLAIYLARQTRTSVAFEFSYWDGVDAISKGLGELYSEPEQREVLQKLADIAFGRAVQFSSDFSSIRL